MITLMIRIALAASLTSLVCITATRFEHGIVAIQKHQQHEAATIGCFAEIQCSDF
ncbi:MAG: hypothetical protein WB681_05750 [Candidatus Cybelea sp.]